VADDNEGPKPKQGCWWCDLAIAPIWAIAALFLNVEVPKSFSRGERVLVIAFWSILAALGVIILGRLF